MAWANCCSRHYFIILNYEISYGCHSEGNPEESLTLIYRDSSVVEFILNEVNVLPQNDTTGGISISVEKAQHKG